MKIFQNTNSKIILSVVIGSLLTLIILSFLSAPSLVPIGDDTNYFIQSMLHPLLLVRIYMFWAPLLLIGVWGGSVVGVYLIVRFIAKRRR